MHRCPYSSVTAADGSGNHCIHAHSDKELDEWRERYRWRQSRKLAAKQQHLYSYMAELHDEYNNDDTDSTVSPVAAAAADDDADAAAAADDDDADDDADDDDDDDDDAVFISYFVT